MNTHSNANSGIPTPTELPHDLTDGQEIWRMVTIPEFSEIYEVSNYGRVRSKARAVRQKNGGVQIKKGQQMVRQRLRGVNGGYLQVPLSNNGYRKHMAVHRLVALAFLQNPEDKPEVNHKDRNRANPRLSNLEWVTRAENLKHARLLGWRVPTKFGEQHHLSTISDNQRRDIIRRSAFETQGAIAASLNLNQSTISKIISKRSRYGA